MDGWEKKRRMKQRYDITANIYDMRYSEEQAAKIESALENTHMEESGRVLDVGCGTGVLFSYVADKAKIVVGIDISRKSLLVAKNRAQSFPKVWLVLADADNMPLREKLFSHIFAFTVIQNMPNPHGTLKEIRRVAGRNSAIVVTALKKTFSLREFEELLRNSGLKVVTMKTEENLKCFVALCK